MSKKYRKSSRRSRKNQSRVGGEEHRVQVELPLVELLTVARESVTAMAMEAGLLSMRAILEDEVERLVGRRYERQENRQATRWGTERGAAVVGGQKVPLERPRVRRVGGGEIPLERYELFRSGGQDGLEESAVDKILATVSTRRYEEVIDTVADSYGIKRSSVSRHWKVASAKQVRELMERPLGDLNLLAVMIDGIEFGEHTIVVALGFTVDGRKVVLGLWPGATENAEVTKDLLTDLVERGLPTNCRLLFALDGSKALRKAVKAVFGENAEIHRCQEHKKRNILSYIPKSKHRVVSRRLKGAWELEDYEEAKKALKATVEYLREISSSAAESLEEALEDTLTLQRLGVPASLRRTFRTTNPIENLFSGVRKTCRNVKRWRGQDMSSAVLSELRILASGKFDAQTYLTVILAGDMRLADRFRKPDLLPLGSRIRTRLLLDYASQDELRSVLRHALKKAGAPQLLSDKVQGVLVEHAAGNYRVLMIMAGELLMTACERELAQIDEKLFLELCQERTAGGRSKTGRGGR